MPLTPPTLQPTFRQNTREMIKKALRFVEKFPLGLDHSGAHRSCWVTGLPAGRVTVFGQGSVSAVGLAGDAEIDRESCSLACVGQSFSSEAAIGLLAQV
jgi:hypothetical protein